MVRKIITLLFVFSAQIQYAQPQDSTTSEGSFYINIGNMEDTLWFHSYVKWMEYNDSWNHNIEEADLVLKVEIIERICMTDDYNFYFKVLEVLKGEYKQPNGTVEFGRGVSRERYRAFMDSNIVYVSFMKTTIEKETWDFVLVDKETGNVWEFFMTANIYKRQ